MKFVGIDIGGMTIKGGIVDEKGNILYKNPLLPHPGKKTGSLWTTLRPL